MEKGEGRIRSKRPAGRSYRSAVHGSDELFRHEVNVVEVNVVRSRVTRRPSSKKEIAMSLQTLAGKFMDLCNQGKHFEVMRTMYVPEMISVEGDGKETVGKDAVIHKSEVFQGDNAIQSQDLRGPF